MKKISMIVLSAILLVSNLFIDQKSGEIRKESIADKTEKKGGDRVSYDENKNIVYIVKSNFTEEEDDLKTRMKLESFSKLVAKLDEERGVHRGRNSKYELGYLLRSLSAKLLIRNK